MWLKLFLLFGGLSQNIRLRAKTKSVKRTGGKNREKTYYYIKPLNKNSNEIYLQKLHGFLRQHLRFLSRMVGLLSPIFEIFLKKCYYCDILFLFTAAVLKMR